MRATIRWISISTVVLLLLASWAATARAQSGDYTRSGPYVSISGLWITDLYEDELEDQLGDAFGPVNVDIEESFGLNARLGARFLAILALELQYEWVKEYEIDFNVPGLPGDRIKADVTHHTLTANARVNIPLGPVQPFVLAGVGFQHLEADGEALLGPVLVIKDEIDDTVFAGRVGAGVEIYLNENLAILVEGTAVLTDERVDIAGQKIDNIFYAGAGAGLTYRF